MNVPRRETSVSAPSTLELWQRAASRAPAIGMRVRVTQLAWAVLVAAGAVPALAILKQSLVGGYAPGLINTGAHLFAIVMAWFGVSRAEWAQGPGDDRMGEREARARRFALLVRILLAEASVLIAIAPLRTLVTGAWLQWGWPALLSVAMLLISWALERIVRAELREYRRLAAQLPQVD